MASGPGMTAGPQEPVGEYRNEIDIIFILADLMKNSAEIEYLELQRLKSLLGGQHGEFSPTLQGVDNESWSKMTDQEKNKLVESICDELMASIEKWSPNIDAFEPGPMRASPRGPMGKTGPKLQAGLMGPFQSVYDALWITIYILPHLQEWQFGKMANILFNFPDSKVPEEMCKNDIMHLIDAGLFLNSPYPSAMREARDVDVIISFDFSQDTPFATVQKARYYAAKNKRPFPKIDVKDQDDDRPESFYVFEEEGKPTVIHIPLFNMDNCKDESIIKSEWNEYGTFQKTYRDKEKINHLADLAAENVRRNKDGILKEIRKAAERRMAKR